MALILRHSLPRFIERNTGTTTTLDADVYSAAGVQQTASAGTVSVYAGSRLIVDGAAATTLGPPATYDLASQPTTQSLSDRWLEVWTLTIGGVVYKFRRDAMLVRHVLYPVITDTDLAALHSDIAALRDSDQTSFEVQRGRAWERLQRKLIARGRRPQLVMSAWALSDPHSWMTLEILFTDWAASVGDGRYLQLADHYRQLSAAWWDTESNFRYDADEDGTQDADEKATARPVIFLNRPPSWSSY